MMNMRCRFITLDDSKDVLRWRNDLGSREMSTNAGVITAVEHSLWFANMLDNRSHIGIVGEIKNEKIGVVFVLIRESTSKVSINLNPVHRGKRLGGILLRSSIIEVQKLFPKLQQFTADIKDTNTASKKIFVQNGFYFHAKKSGFSIYRLTTDGLGVN